MNEIELGKGLISQAPIVAALVWALWRQYKLVDTLMGNYSQLVKDNAAQYASLVKDTNETTLRNTEMLGRAGAYVARAADVLGDLPKGKA